METNIYTGDPLLNPADRPWKIEFIKKRKGSQVHPHPEQMSDGDLNSQIHIIVQTTIRKSEVIALDYIGQHWFKKKYGASA